MTSSRPYLIRALYEWIIDNQMTPHLVIDAELPGVQVPPQAVQNGKVTINIATQAVEGLSLGDEWLEFAARFGGVSHTVMAPVSSVLAIFARENGQGMMFPPEGEDSDPGGKKDPDGEGATPHLTVVK